MSADPEFSGLKGQYSDVPEGVWTRMRHSWLNMRAVTRKLLDEAPSEGRLIFYLVMSDLIFFLSWTFKTVVVPVTQETDGPLPEDPGLRLVLVLILALLVRTAMFYLASVVVWVMCRGVGGDGNWRDTKAGMFWGSLVSAPYGFAAAIVTVLLLQVEGTLISSELAVLIPFVIAMLPFVWYISAGVSEAHRFTQSIVLFVVLSIVVFGIITALILLNLESFA